jgi:hypothetical protein
MNRYSEGMDADRKLHLDTLILIPTLTWRNIVRKAHMGLIRSTYTTGYNSCVTILKC